LIFAFFFILFYGGSRRTQIFPLRRSHRAAALRAPHPTISPFPKWCSFLEKFELISKKIVNVLARPASRGSQLSRGAPTRRASEKVGSNIPPKAEQRKTQKF